MKLTQEIYHEAEQLSLACMINVPKISCDSAAPAQRSTITAQRGPGRFGVNVIER
jgi:hypothetical protein